MDSITIPDLAYVVARLAWVRKITAKQAVARATNKINGAYYNHNNDTLTIVATTKTQAEQIWDQVWQNIKATINRDNIAA